MSPVENPEDYWLLRTPYMPWLGVELENGATMPGSETKTKQS